MGSRSWCTFSSLGDKDIDEGNCTGREAVEDDRGDGFRRDCSGGSVVGKGVVIMISDAE